MVYPEQRHVAGARLASGVIVSPMTYFILPQRSMPASLILATTEEAAWKRLQDLSVCVRLAGLDLLALIVRPLKIVLKMC